MQKKLVSVIGGTGFLGRYVVQALAQQGYRVQVIARRATRAMHLIPVRAESEVVLRDGDVTRPKTLQGALDGSFAVVNLVGVLFESGRQRFSAIHAQCPERIAEMAREAGVQQFVHISAIGADDRSQSSYARSKATGEKAVQSIFPNAVILRPSVIFGPEDDFLNKFAHMARISPFLPLIGGGQTRFQPVYAPDVAKAVTAVLADSKHAGKIYELGGPDVVTFEGILRYIMEVTGLKRRFLPLPFSLASLIGTVGQQLPVPPLTADQVRLLRYDNVVDESKDGFKALHITPMPMRLIVPDYLERYRPQAVRTQKAMGSQTG
jgi:NADH dehydrogenase